MMKAKYLLFTAIMAFSMISMGQEMTKEERKAQKKEEKAAKKAAKMEAQVVAINRMNELINMKEWVLEGASVTNKKGVQLMNLNSSVNFMYVNGEDDVVIQLSFENLPGWDGIPMLTVKGRATMYEVKENGEGKPVSLRAQIIGPGGSADVFLSPNPNGSVVTISGNWGNRINLTGEIKHPSESLVYKGATRFGN